MDLPIVGVLGAGQLGRMFVEAASRLNAPVRLLDVGHLAPAKQISYVPDASGSTSQHVDGSFAEASQIRELARRVDILTVEIEHVDADQLQAVLDEGIVKAVHPLPSTIKLIQDKYAQKKHLVEKGLPVAEFQYIGSEAAGAPPDPQQAAEQQKKDIIAAGKKYGYPLMIKSRTQAYDGKGNYVVREEGEGAAVQAVEALGSGKRGLYAEKWAPFTHEVAVMVVRSASGEVRSYPAVETVHVDNICHTVYAPLRIADATVASRARDIAEKAVATFGGAGVFGVEMFLLDKGELFINEIAPRPHNSGHYTIEAAETSQYENHLRAILDLPLGGTAMKVPSAAMLNILGLSDLDKDPGALDKTLAPAVASLAVPGATTHLYGKTGCRKGRKMGHITIVGQNDAEVRQRLAPLLSALETATQAAADGSVLPSGLTVSTLRKTPTMTPSPAAGYSHPQPLVGIIMGSDSDLPVMRPAAVILKQFGVPFELTIVSAHRTAQRMTEYAHSSRARGLRAIIAGAGGAAHLPGMVASETVVPVIGVPVKASVLDGVDSLYSIVQMPRGIPVATVGINNSTNAALLAIRLLGATDTKYADQLEQYMRDLEGEVLEKVERLKVDEWDYVVGGKK